MNNGTPIDIGTRCANAVLAIDQAREELRHAAVAVDDYLAAHNYCFNSNDDEACDVHGGDCRATREQMHTIRYELDAVRGVLSQAGLVPRRIDAYTRTEAGAGETPARRG